jgi:hypothetical protein
MADTPVYGTDGSGQEDLVARVADLESKLAAAEAASQRPGTPITLIPEHAGGPGLTAAPVWSQALQEKSRAGTLTADDYRTAGLPVPEGVS